MILLRNTIKRNQNEKKMIDLQLVLVRTELLQKKLHKAVLSRRIVVCICVQIDSSCSGLMRTRAHSSGRAYSGLLIHKLLRIFLLACLGKLISSEDCFCDRSALCIVLSGGGLVLCHECVLLNPHHCCKLIIVHFGYSFAHIRGWRSLLSFCF